MAGPLHALFHSRGEKACQCSAQAVFCAGGVLRQSDLPSSCRRRCPRTTTHRCQSHHRSTQQTHPDLRPPHHPSSWRQAPDGDRGSESCQSRDPQSLPQGLPQTVRPRSLPPPYRNSDQQYLDRLRHRQDRGESSSVAEQAGWHHRSLSGCAARYLGNLCGSRGTSPTHPADASPQRQTHSWPEAGPAPTVGPHAFLSAFLLPRRRRYLHHPRPIPKDLAGTLHDTGTVQARIPSLCLWKLRAKGLLEKIPHSRRYRLHPHGYQICLVFLKLYEKIYAPLTAGILHPFAADQSIPKERITALDLRYTAVMQALDDLVDAVGLKAA